MSGASRDHTTSPALAGTSGGVSAGVAASAIAELGGAMRTELPRLLAAVQRRLRLATLSVADAERVCRDGFPRLLDGVARETVALDLWTVMNGSGATYKSIIEIEALLRVLEHLNGEVPS